MFFLKVFRFPLSVFSFYFYLCTVKKITADEVGL